MLSKGVTPGFRGRPGGGEGDRTRKSQSSARASQGTRSESSGSGPRKAIEGQKMLHVIISILLFDLFWWLRR